MNPRYRFTALAVLSLSAGAFYSNVARAEATAPFKVDPRLLGLPALEEPTPAKINKPTTEQPKAFIAPESLPPARPAPQPELAKPTPLPAPTLDEQKTASKPAIPKAVEQARPAPKQATIESTPPKTETPEPRLAKPVTPPPSAREEKPVPLRTPEPAPVVALPTEPPALPPATLDSTPLRLQPTLSMTPHPAQPDEKLPVFVSAMRIQGKAEEHVEAEEDVELRKRGLIVNADQLRYTETSETIDAKGNVRLQSDTAVVKGPDLHYKVSDSTGFMNSPVYALAGAQSGQGKAEKLTFVNEDRLQLEDGRFSSCAVNKEDWWIQAGHMDIDRSTNTGVGYNAVVQFKGVPLLYTPYISFPLRRERKSGFLAPAFGTSDTRGAEISVPYYFNLAPNYDATITPRLMSKRGLQVGGEFRYLNPNYAGEVQGEFLPNDRVTKTDRTAFRLTHAQNFGAGFGGNIEFQKVSDDNYYRDLSTLIAATSKTVLPRQGNLSYGYGNFNANLLVQKYQILQDPVTPIAEPYERAPQLTAAYRKLNAFGLADVVAQGEYVRFAHSSLVRGARLTLHPSVAVPLTQAYGYITPKVGVHYTRYNLEQNQNPQNLPDTTRTLPILSVDSGLTFERPTTLFSQSVTQTLEPRLYYLYVPFKNQNNIPLFDTGEPDFTFAQIFSENRFSGGDRISDANQATLALTSRFIESTTGFERLRASVAQRYFFKTPRVTISPTTAAPTDKASDFLASIGGQITKAWSADATVQYNPNIGRNEKYNFSTRYNPEPGKLANFTYRFTRSALHQADASGQWQITPNVQLLGRLNYSIQDSRIVEALGGFEYREGCWAVRLVAHRFQTATQQTTNALFLQLELSDLASLGTNPFNTLKQNIGGYSQTKPQHEEINLNEF